MRKYRGQSSLEFILIVTIVLGALLSMQVYMKRGLQGRWKSSVDEIGEQYDPAGTNGDETYTVKADTTVHIKTVPDGGGGYWTLRSDSTNMYERKGGTSRVGASN